ncbi:hypothetical protein, partial [Salmonella sp. SAL4357]|uniref:hypothetical protein n=1 Tax=Salmonella sp. SAL4357 TaxID=3159878 RepID=UPI00397A4545
ATDSLDARRVRLVDAETFEDLPVQLGGLPESRAPATDLDYSSDGRFLAVVFQVSAGDGTEIPEDGEVVVWDMAEPSRPPRHIE